MKTKKLEYMPTEKDFADAMTQITVISLMIVGGILMLSAAFFN